MTRVKIRLLALLALLAVTTGALATLSAPETPADEIVGASATEPAPASLRDAQALIQGHKFYVAALPTTTTTTTTTTTAPPPPPPTTAPPVTTTAPPPPPPPAPTYTGSYREQFPHVPDIMWTIAGCESYGRPDAGPNWTAANPTSSARGAWQDLKSTWNGYAGYASADLAPPHIQVEFNMSLYQSMGTRPWNASKHCWS